MKKPVTTRNHGNDSGLKKKYTVAMRVRVSMKENDGHRRGEGGAGEAERLDSASSKRGGFVRINEVMLRTVSPKKSHRGR